MTKRRVKCVATGEYGDSETFIKVDKHYYKSQEIYEEYRHSIDCKKKAIDILCKDFLKYKAGQPCPTFVFRKYKSLEFYENEIILKTIEEKYDTLKYYADNKEFKDDIQKVSYLFAIIDNNIGDVYRREERKKLKKKTEELYENKLDDVASSLNSDGKTKSGRMSQRDISEFCEEGIDVI